MIAAGQGHVEVLRVLLEAGADANHGDTDGCTALQAAFDSHARCVFSYTVVQLDEHP